MWGSGVDCLKNERFSTGRGPAQHAGPHSWVAPVPPTLLVPLQCHQGLVQPLSSEAPVWKPPQHGELRQQGAEVGAAGGAKLPWVPLRGWERSQAHRRELEPTPAFSSPGSTRTGKALSMTCVCSWRRSTSPTRWRSGWRRTSAPTWTSCGTWCRTTGLSSASTAGPR